MQQGLISLGTFLIKQESTLAAGTSPCYKSYRAETLLKKVTANLLKFFKTGYRI
jgi:hypothetical protein